MSKILKGVCKLVTREEYIKNLCKSTEGHPEVWQYVYECPEIILCDYDEVQGRLGRCFILPDGKILETGKSKYGYHDDVVSAIYEHCSDEEINKIQESQLLLSSRMFDKPQDLTDEELELTYLCLKSLGYTEQFVHSQGVIAIACGLGSWREIILPNPIYYGKGLTDKQNEVLRSARLSFDLDSARRKISFTRAAFQKVVEQLGDHSLGNERES